MAENKKLSRHESRRVVFTLLFAWEFHKEEKALDFYYANKADAVYRETNDPAATSAYVLSTIGRTLAELTKNLRARYPDLPIVYAGGVMSSRYIRRMLSPYGSFAEAQFSSDNATGVCLLARETHIRETKLH